MSYEKDNEQGFTRNVDKETISEEFKAFHELNTKRILEAMTKALSEALFNSGTTTPKRNEIDYMCSQCQGCLFFEEVNMGMEGIVYLCKANEPKDSYFEGHVMRWVSACDCRDEEIKKIHLRKCPHYCSYAKLMREKLKEVKSKNKGN